MAELLNLFLGVTYAQAQTVTIDRAVQLFKNYLKFKE
jgi:hypothetical protein